MVSLDASMVSVAGAEVGGRRRLGAGSQRSTSASLQGAGYNHVEQAGCDRSVKIGANIRTLPRLSSNSDVFGFGGRVIRVMLHVPL